ncbi:MAG: dTMP kinase [Micrococcaceae bacterium]
MSIFITFEGADGSGKTTQIVLLQKWLQEKYGLEVIQTREPGGTPLGEALRDLVLTNRNTPANPKAEALLFAASRSQHVSDLIRPALEDGKVVLCDRYIDSSVAYQGYGRELGAKKIADLSLWATDNLTPDLCIVLDIDADTSAARRGKRSADDKIEAEGIAFQERVRNIYLELAKLNPETHKVVNAAKDIDNVFAEIKELIAKRLKQK